MYLLGFVIYVGAHTHPVGNALDLSGRLILGIMVLIYASGNYPLGSFIYGKLIGFPSSSVQD